MTRLIQIKRGHVRRVGLVEEPNLRLLDACSSIYELALLAVTTGVKLSDLVRQRARHETLDYDGIYEGRSEWHLLPAIDHPDEPACCLISGTGLTHLGSARGRQSMHAAANEDLTDSMKMFGWGVEGGRPGAGALRSGFTKARVVHCGATENRSTFLPTPRTVERRPRSRGFTWSLRMGGRIAWASLSAMSFPTINSKRRTTSTLLARSSVLAPWDQNLLSMRNSNRYRSPRRSNGVATYSGPRPSALANPRCVTACKTLSIIISSLKGTGSRDRFISIFSEPTV
jgi:hypothetical protein